MNKIEHIKKLEHKLLLLEEELNSTKTFNSKILVDLVKTQKALDKACELLCEQLGCPLEVFNEEISYCDSFNCGEVNPKRCWRLWCIEHKKKEG